MTILLKIKYLLVTLLCAGTICFFNVYPRYEIIGQELLSNSDFKQGLQNWQSSFFDSVNLETSGTAKLQTSTPFDSPILYQTIQKSFTSSLLLLSTEVKTQKVVGGDASWKCARVALIATDKYERSRFDRPHLLVALTGSRDWQRYHKAFNIAADIDHLMVAIQLLQSTGTLWVRDISLKPAKIAETFVQIRFCLFWGWVTLITWIVLPLLRMTTQDRKYASILFLALLILLGVLMPENVKENIGSQLLQNPSVGFDTGIHMENEDSQKFKLTLQIPPIDIYKIGHFIMFAILSFATPLLATWEVIIGLCLFAFSSEVLQLFVAGRTPQSGDVLLDILGIGSGILLLYLKNKLSFFKPNR